MMWESPQKIWSCGKFFFDLKFETQSATQFTTAQGHIVLGLGLLAQPKF